MGTSNSTKKWIKSLDQLQKLYQISHNWIKSVIVSSGSQLQITQIVISIFNTKVEMQKL